MLSTLRQIEMNGKLAGGIYQEEEGCSTTELVNPFVHHLELETTYEKIKVSAVLLFFCHGGKLRINLLLQLVSVHIDT